MTEESSGLTPATYTNRVVIFNPVNAKKDEDQWDRFFDALADFYCDHPDHGWIHRHVLRRGRFLSACNGIVSIDGWPWWIPAWYARKQVAAIALHCGLGGEATFKVERAVFA